MLIVILQCDRVPGEDCSLCQKAGVDCGPSLSAKEARALMARLRPDSASLGAMKEAEERGKGLASGTYQKEIEVSVSSGARTAFGQSSFKVMNMFDRIHLGEDLNRW